MHRYVRRRGHHRYISKDEATDANTTVVYLRMPMLTCYLLTRHTKRKREKNQPMALFGQGMCVHEAARNSPRWQRLSRAAWRRYLPGNMAAAFAQTSCGVIFRCGGAKSQRASIRVVCVQQT